MERAEERRNKQAFSFLLIPPHPTLSRWKGIAVLRAELIVMRLPFLVGLKDLN
jgi:hypothetical protein